MKHDAYRGAKEVCEKLQAGGFEAYLVGGCVRDALLGAPPKDFDIATSAKPDKIRKLFDKTAEVAPGEAYSVVVIGVGDCRFEVATFRRDLDSVDNRRPTAVEFASLDEDAGRRDFTVNALYLDPVTMQLVDLVGGLDDLDAKRLRFVGDPARRIDEDRLRVLRAVRFKNRFGFDYAPETATTLRTIGRGETPTNSPFERGSPPDSKSVEAGARGYLLPIKSERVQDELTRMLEHTSRAESLTDMDKFGLLGVFLPEIAAEKGVIQPKEFHGEGDVFVHTLDVMRHLPEKPSATLAWASLLHDVGKPSVQMIDNDRRIRFFGHAEKGSLVAREILTRLRFSKREVEDISWLVLFHMGPMGLVAMRPAKREALMRERLFPELIALYRADTLGSRFSDDAKKNKELDGVMALWQEFRRRPAVEREKSLKDIGVDGNMVIRVLELAEGGPAVRKALEGLNVAFLEGKIKNQEEAIDWLKANR